MSGFLLLPLWSPWRMSFRQNKGLVQILGVLWPDWPQMHLTWPSCLCNYFTLRKLRQIRYHFVSKRKIFFFCISLIFLAGSSKNYWGRFQTISQEWSLIQGGYKNTKNAMLRAGKMSPWVTCSPHKHKNPSLDPQHPHKGQVLRYMHVI